LFSKISRMAELRDILSGRSFFRSYGATDSLCTVYLYQTSFHRPIVLFIAYRPKKTPAATATSVSNPILT
jgi:hypothetical protein